MPVETFFLDSESVGRWLVVTKTSTYYLDLDAHTAIRIPNRKQEQPEGYDVKTLRKDGEVWSISNILRCRVGFNLELKVTGTHKKHGVMTLRRSTPVVSISAL